MDSFDPHTGSELTLRKMLDGDISLIIPDMQRDYCWDGVRVEAFVGQLVDIFATRGSVTMGLLYGYESPPGSHRLMLIDGQQRITTLYLLLGMLYRRVPEPWLRRLLISDYELRDDRQPRLVYQVRSEAMYFMSDLVTYFFLDRDGRLSRLRESHWYFTSYDSDPTVTAAIAAIHAIDDELEKAATRQGWDFGEFARYVADRLLFIYHDAGSRPRAESLFVTINTTGEPLSRPQLIKTELYLLADDKADFARRWGELERWCWRHRDASGHDTGDGVLSWLIRLWEAYSEASGEPAVFDEDALDSICAFHGLVKRLVAEVPGVMEMKTDMPEHVFALLPSLEYIRLWGGEVMPLWRMLTNITRYRRVSANGSDTAMAIKLVNVMPDSDIVSLLKVRGNYERVLTAEEKGKLRLLARSGGRRPEIAGLLARGEAHPMLNGCVMPVVKWCRGRNDDDVDGRRLRRYIDRMYEIWHGDIDCDPGLDIVRRALLAMRHPAYPMTRRSGASLSLAWHYYDWQRLMSLAPDLIRKLIDRTESAASAIDALRLICEKFNDRNYEWSFLIVSGEVMASCAHRALMRPCPPFVGMHVTGKDDITRWYVGQYPLKPDLREFSNPHPYGSRCVYIDHRSLNLAIDIYWEPEGRHPFRLEVFARKDDDRRQRRECDIPGLLREARLSMDYDRRRGRHYAFFADARSVAAAFNRLVE